MPGPGTEEVQMHLGSTTDDGIAPSIFVLAARGAELRPDLAGRMRGRVEMRFAEDIAPVRLEFDGRRILVEDGTWDQPDFRIYGRLPHIVGLTAAPNVAGVPRPTNRRGRSALAKLASGKVRLEGDRRLGRELLQLLSV